MAEQHQQGQQHKLNDRLKSCKILLKKLLEINPPTTYREKEVVKGIKLGIKLIETNPEGINFINRCNALDHIYQTLLFYKIFSSLNDLFLENPFKNDSNYILSFK